MNTTLKRLAITGLVTLLLTAIAILPVGAQSEEQIRELVLAALITDPEFVGWIDQFPNFDSDVYEVDGNLWQADFYDTENRDEWIGYGQVDISTAEVTEAFAPRPLDAEAYQEQLPKVEMVVLSDPEVLARLVDPVLWDQYTDFNRWDQVWEVYFVRGIEAVNVSLYINENGRIMVDGIYSPNELTRNEELQAAKDEAINLAYTGEGIDLALEGHDDWITYVENVDGSRWTVSFNAGDTELFFALVDVETDEVLMAKVGGAE
jgi:hypothetical protein